MIVFVDDEPARVDLYLEELEDRLGKERVRSLAGLDSESIPSLTDFDGVVFCDSPDMATKVVRQYLGRLGLVVLDLMMPSIEEMTPRRYDDGLNSGETLYDRLRDWGYEGMVVILTNVQKRKLKEQFQADSSCLYFQKNDLDPESFVDIVEKYLLTE